jgi:hypothetical protein
LWTVRNYGGGRLIGLLPTATVKVNPPKSDGIWYDLMRSREVTAAVEATPGSPVLLVERTRRTAKIAFSDSGEIRLTQEGGGAADSVVRVDVLDARGRVAAHYSRNVVVRAGRGKFSVPWAVSDAGEWTIRVRDVVSGMMAERKRRV